MRGAKVHVADEDYDVGADADEGRQAGGEKPLSSRYRGVCWNRKNRRWQAAINSGGKYVYLGSFLSEHDAARAFDKAAVKLRGTRAKLNFQYSEYVDENGNLLEDPKMKNVMHKIEAIQGGAGHGGSGGHHHGSGGVSGGGGGGHHKNDSGADDGHLLTAVGGDGLHPPPIPLPLPLLPAEDGGAPAAQPAALPPPPLPPPHRQLSPLLHAGGGSAGGGVHGKQQSHACSSDGSKGPEWPGPRGGTLPPVPQQQQSLAGLNLAVLPSSLQQQQQRSQAQACLDASPFPPPFAEAVGRAAEGPVGGLLGGPPPPLPPPGRMPQMAITRGRGGSYSGPQPTLPLNHLYGGGGGGNPPAPCLSGSSGVGGGAPGCYDILPPGRAPPGYGGCAAAAGGGGDGPPRPPISAAAVRAILQELGAKCNLLGYVQNRFINGTEDMAGVLYRDVDSPTLYGSAVWTGKLMIRMGLYDTERDARQACIRCMQLHCVFYQEEVRVEVFNAVTKMLHCRGGPEEAGSSTQQYADAGGAPAPPLPLPYGGPRAASRVSGGGLSLNEQFMDAQHQHHHHHQHHGHTQGGPYGPRGSGGGAAGLSYNGPGGDGGLQHQHQQQAPSSSGYAHDAHAGEAGCAAGAVQAGGGGGVKQSQDLNQLFQYMAMIKASSRNTNNINNSGNGNCDAGGGGGGGGADAHGRPDSLQLESGGGGGGGAAGVLSKRAALQLDGGGGSYRGLCEQQHQQHQPAQRLGSDYKRIRVDADGGAEVELVLKPPGSESRVAHKMELSLMIKQLQQVQQASAVGL